MVLMPYKSYKLTSDKTPKRLRAELMMLCGKDEDSDYKAGREAVGENEAVIYAQVTAEGFNPRLYVRAEKAGEKTEVYAKITFSKAAYIAMAVLFAALFVLLLIGIVLLVKAGEAALVSMPIVLIIIFYALSCFLFSLAQRRIFKDLIKLI